jgi:hypothetical protein
MTLNIPHEIGKLIKQRKPYKGDPWIYEHFNILIGQVRKWYATTDLAERLAFAQAINRTRGELADLGVVVG